MKNHTYIEGFDERLEEAIRKSGLNKCQIARLCDCNRKVFINRANDMSSTVYIAKFCAVTKTDANWLLGITK